MEVPRVAWHTALAYVATAGGCALFVATAVWILLRDRRAGHPSAAWALAMGLGVGVASDAILVTIVGGRAPATVAYILSYFFAYPMMGALAFHWASRARGAPTPTPLVGLAAIALHTVSFAAEAVGSVGSSVVSARGIESDLYFVTALLMMLPVVATIIALAAARPPQGLRVTLLAGTIVAFGLAELIVVAKAHRVEDVGLRGTARLVAFGCMTAAALGLGWLGSRGALSTSRARLAAAIALPALLIVAQIAQNFLSAQYGLIMGGVVAGALLVAAKPIERALEGRREARANTPDDAREDAYRKALRIALRDRALTRDEETHLHELAEQLGIGAGRAHAIMVEVEREPKERA